ncbi:MAG: prepilin peptidase, partial [Telluria sp.]
AEISESLNAAAGEAPPGTCAAGASSPATAASAAKPAPAAFNLIVPRSRCPHCGHQITASENIPVLSWLWLRGRCSACKARISARYPLIEVLSGGLAFACIWYYGLTLVGVAAVALSFALITLAFIDFDTQLLPDDITLPLLWAGLLLNLAGGFASLQDAVIGAVAGYLLLWSIYWIFRLLTGKEGMGYGDFKLLAALGAWLGWTMLPTIILLSSVVGAVVGISLIVFTKHGREKPIPFGPYLAAAGLIALLFGNQVSAFTQSFLN